VIGLFGQRLRKLREAKGLTQEELAKVINVSNKTISVYEKGGADPSTETLLKLAQYFNVSVDYLLGHTDNPTPDHARKPTLEDEFPEVANVLRRSGKRLTPEDKKRIARIIKAAIEDVDEE